MPSKTKKLLDLIGSIESAKGYNYEFGNREVPLDQMTIEEVLEHQKKRRKEGKPSSAVGRYQFIHKTLEDLARRNPNDLPKDALFTPEVQDKAAEMLLQRRGLSDYEAGNLSDEEFLLNLSKEWASLPNPETGASYYDKDGLNKSLVPVDAVLEAARTVKQPEMTEEEMLARQRQQVSMLRGIP